MNTQGVERLVKTFTSLSLFGKVIVFLICFVLGAALVSLGGYAVHRYQSARYNAREAARMQQVQNALALAEAATRRAETAEAQAELIRQQNDPRAAAAAAARQRLEEEGQRAYETVQTEYHADVAHINSDLSACERCRDICARVERLAASSPALAEYRCGADTCAGDCPADAAQ